MRRSNFYMKLVSAVILCGLLLYIGAYLLRSVKDPLTTALAIEYRQDFGYETQGIIIRDETVIYGGGANTYILRAEGERVGSGQPVAVSYDSAADLQTAEELRSVEAQIDQLETIIASVASGSYVLTANGSAAALAMKLSGAVDSHELDDISALAAEFRTLTYYSSDDSGAAAASERLAELKNRRWELESELAYSSQYIYSGISGVFTRSVDGYEDIGLNAGAQLSAAELESMLLYGPGEKSTDSLGKVVQGIKYYYVTEMSSDEAKKLSEGATVEIKFDRYYSDVLEMTVEKVHAPESGGKCAAVFSCSRAMAETIQARKLSGKVVYSSVSGIRVPKKSIRLDENGGTCVYVLTAARAELRPVEIIYEVGDYYIVKNTEDTKALREGDEIIVRGKGLYDGKVVG